MWHRGLPRVALRLIHLDLLGDRRGWRALPRQMAIALAAFLIMLALRGLMDLWIPGVAPFAPIYPLLLVATLSGRLGAGLIGLALMMGYAAYTSVAAADGEAARALAVPRAAINAIVGLIMVGIAELARGQGLALIAEREARIAERDVLLAEVDHRVKNNLAILSSLFAMQIRASDSDAVREELGKAVGRVQSLAQAYDRLRYRPDSVAVVDAAPLLEGLATSLREALALDGSPSLEVEADPVMIGRDRAVAVALLVNEVVTNAAKHAFVGRVGGRICVRLTGQGSRAVLEIADDGIGMPKELAKAGLGRRLLHTLAKMARGKLTLASDRSGTRYRLTLDELP
jgi:two-component sensor histidine kinase